MIVGMPLANHGMLRDIQFKIQNLLKLDVHVEARFEPPGTIVLVLREKREGVIIDASPLRPL